MVFLPAFFENLQIVKEIIDNNRPSGQKLFTKE